MEMEIFHRHKELNAFFENVDHADVKTIEGEVSLRQFIAGLLSYHPRWLVFLYYVRELLVKALGLVRHAKPELHIKPEELAFEPGRKALFFIVRAARENTYWVSESPADKHLSAYFGVVAEACGTQSNRFHVFTTVKYLHWSGPVYFNLIRPFHHLVVARMMRAGVSKKGQLAP